MAKDKVTIQDIADALHLSRTTVSKALNGAPNMPAKTISAVWNKAKEMNYKQFAYLQPQNISEHGSPKKGRNFCPSGQFYPGAFPYSVRHHGQPGIRNQFIRLFPHHSHDQYW